MTSHKPIFRLTTIIFCLEIWFMICTFLHIYLAHDISQTHFSTATLIWGEHGCEQKPLPGYRYPSRQERKLLQLTARSTTWTQISYTYTAPLPFLFIPYTPIGRLHFIIQVICFPKSFLSQIMAIHKKANPSYLTLLCRLHLICLCSYIGFDLELFGASLFSFFNFSITPALGAGDENTLGKYPNFYLPANTIPGTFPSPTIRTPCN